MSVGMNHGLEECMELARELDDSPMGCHQTHSPTRHQKGKAISLEMPDPTLAV